MTEFNDLYSEAGDYANLTVGGGGFTGRVFVKAMVKDVNSADGSLRGVSTVTLDSISATLKLGEVYQNVYGTLDMHTVEIIGKEALIRAGGQSGRGQGRVELRNRLGKNAVLLDASTGTVSIGEERTNGHLSLKNDDGTETAHINGQHGNLSLGGPGADGDISIKSSANLETLQINGETAFVKVGGENTNGRVQTRNAAGAVTADLLGEHGNLVLGGEGADGDLSIKSSNNVQTCHIDGESAVIKAGGENTNGRLQLRNASGTVTADMIGEHGNLVLGGEGADGDITLRSSANEDVIRMDGNDAKIIVGGVGANGDIIMRNNRDVDTIRITGSNGDIEFMNADFAEEFTIDQGALAVATPGTVMVLSDTGTLVPCGQGYDSRVIGVIAGAGAYRPALVLDKKGGDDRMPVAMVGKVMCRVTADPGAIKMGDLLTTSDVPGHAMKVSDRSQALGAVIGKALAPLAEGQAMIPVLVNLQ